MSTKPLETVNRLDWLARGKHMFTLLPMHARAPQHAQVCAVSHRADSWLAIDFLNAHGVNVTFPDIVPPPDPSEWHTQEMSDVLYAFTKACPPHFLTICPLHPLTLLCDLSPWPT